MVNLFIVEDHPSMRTMLNLVARGAHDLTVVGTSTGENLVEEILQKRPDVVIMDIRMPGADGIEATRTLRRLGSDIKILLFSALDDDKVILDGMIAGANGFLSKTTSINSLINAIHAVSSSASFFLDEQVKIRMAQRCANAISPVLGRGTARSSSQ